MFQLIFRGECQPGTDVQTARNNARTLFKASVEQVDRMFSGRPVVIRSRLEQEQAEKYRAVLARHGMVAYVQPMATEQPAPASAEAASPARTEQPSASSEEPPAAGAGQAPARQPGPRIEPGDRLPVAGERADEVLAGSSLGLDPVGTRLAEEREAPRPVFEHLDEWTIAPAGSDLGVERELPPPVVPDVSHLSLEESPEAGKH